MNGAAAMWVVVLVGPGFAGRVAIAGRSWREWSYMGLT